MFLIVLLMMQGGVLGEVWADRGYEELRAGRYEKAIAAFRKALDADAGQVHLRKDLAYTLLKVGEREEAREQFGEALKRDEGDERTALEYAFLCYETRAPREARRVFGRLRGSKNEEIRVAAEAAYERVDRPLREGIEQWREAVRRAPRQWSGHEELARLAEVRDERALAAEHYEHAWRLRPAQESLLLEMARVWKEMGEGEKARTALVAAWRSRSPRVAEAAREMLGGQAPAETELALAAPVVEEIEVLSGPPLAPREMGERSLAGSYLNDAYRYFTMAHDEDPEDGRVLYQLGVTSNLLRRDREALKWFAMARRSSDAKVAEEARSAHEALAPSFRRVGLSAWAIPFYSSRWSSTFLYGQAKAELRGARLGVKPYLSMRMVGDTGGQQYTRMPVGAMFLSEKSVIAAAGVSAPLGRRAFVWGEAGQAFSYVGRRADAAVSQPDYRGGVSYTKGWGRLLGAGPERGWFAETTGDGVYSSRFGDDVLLYTQSRGGWTFARSESGWQAQAHVAWNVTVDRRREYWGNFVEGGPGVRVVFPGLPKGMSFRAEVLRGAHLVNDANPWRPNYWDVRIGMWYALVH